MTNDPYSYWRDALAGKFGDAHVSIPQVGFYSAKLSKARREKTGRLRYVVAIWNDPFTNTLMALRSFGPDDTKSADPLDVWTWCAFSPITEDQYRAIAEKGERWPDEIDPLPAASALGSNNPPPDEAEADEIEAATSAALAELGDGIKDQAHSDRIGNHRDRLLKLYKKIDGDRKETKRPHLEAAATVEEAYKPKLVKIADIGGKLRAALTVWLTAEDARRQRETRERIAAEEEVRRKATEAGTPPPEPTALPIVDRPKSGTAGRATSLRTQKTAIIKDYARVLEHFSEHDEVKVLIQALANRAARAGVPVPGCETKEEKQAA